MIPVEERNFIIIEDSPAVSLLLTDYLKKLGAKNVLQYENGKKGVEAFKKLIKSKKEPIVFLDYNLPDMNGFSVMTQLIKIKPDVKVIIETALERSEQSIKEVIANGAYEYLSKPIRFENIKDIVQSLELEENALIKKDENLTEEVAHMINRNTQVSFAKISEFLNIGKEDFLPIIDKLKSENKVMEVNDIKEIVCHNCDSTRINHVYHCPSCNGSNFKQENLIEHYDCGNVSAEKSSTRPSGETKTTRPERRPTAATPRPAIAGAPTHARGSGAVPGHSLLSCTCVASFALLPCCCW